MLTPSPFVFGLSIEERGCGSSTLMDNLLMTDTPQFIDGARVLAVADMSGVAPTGKTRHQVSGHVVDDFAGLAIARYDTDSCVYLFYCDAEWNTITDTCHDGLSAALDQAEYEFGQVEFAEKPRG